MELTTVEKIKDFLCLVGLLIFCTVVGIYKIITFPIRMPVKLILSNRRKKHVICDTIDIMGDMEKDRIGVIRDIAYYCFGMKAEAYGRFALRQRCYDEHPGISFWKNYILSSIYGFLERYVLVTLYNK